MMGTRIDAQSFSKEVGIGSSSHCLLRRDCNRCYISVSDVSLVGKYLVMLEVGKRESRELWKVCMSGYESIGVMEISDCRERGSVVIFPESKEQNASAIELDGREFGSGLEEFRWRSWFIVFQ